MDETQRRKALNEAVFREVNEQIEDLHVTFAAPGAEAEPLALVCECDRLDCLERLDVPLETYERVRRHASRFFVRRGHEDAAVEDVIDGGSDFVVVRKHPGEPQVVAERTDPRG